jgi:phosphatidylglycerophosphate synthase
MTKPSNKIITLPTLISIAGFLLVAHGLYGRKRGLDTISGAVEVAAGKALDLVDGFTARNFLKTDLGKAVAKHVNPDRLRESTAGSKIDPILDQTSYALIGREVWRKNLAPKTILATIAIMEIVKASATVYDQLAHPETADLRRPINSGRHGSFLVNLSVLIFVFEKFLPPNRAKAKSTLAGFGWAIFATGTAMKLTAMPTYINRALGKE